MRNEGMCLTPRGSLFQSFGVHTKNALSLLDVEHTFSASLEASGGQIAIGPIPFE